jgi:protein required for attachment to host cells
MQTTWVLICDAASARAFEILDDGPAWQPVGAWHHAESREKTSELTGDRMGRGSPLGGSAHHNALVPASSPKQTEKNHFGHELVTMLDQAMRAHRFTRWALVAPPQFLGMIKNELTPELNKHLVVSVDKDFVHLDVPDLIDRLANVVRVR